MPKKLPQNDLKPYYLSSLLRPTPVQTLIIVLHAILGRFLCGECDSSTTKIELVLLEMLSLARRAI
jgi:hypothetical protein